MPWPLACNHNPLGLDEEDFIEVDDSPPSDWQKEPEGGFLMLYDDGPDVAAQGYDVMESLDGRPRRKVIWQLIPVDEHVAPAVDTTGLSELQKCLDPRL